MDKVFITIVAILAVLLSASCLYRYFTVDPHHGEIMLAVAFAVSSVIAFNARRWCK